MKKIKIIALISAIVTALFLLLFLNALKQPAAVNKTGVLVAVVDIPANTPVTKDMVTVKYLPDEAVYASAIKDTDWIIGKVSESDIAAGEQLMSTKFIEAGKSGTGTLAYSVEPGMRAITIGVDDTSGLSGMLKPGDKVDIIAFFDNGVNSQTGACTKMLLEDVKVLAVDSVISESGKTSSKTSSSASYTTVTIQVTPSEALKTSLSEYKGKLKVILRSPLDESSTSLPEMTFNKILN